MGGIKPFYGNHQVLATDYCVASQRRRHRGKPPTDEFLINHHFRCLREDRVTMRLVGGRTHAPSVLNCFRKTGFSSRLRTKLLFIITETKQQGSAESWVQGLGLWDSTMLVAGSMIGSGV